MAKFNPYKYVKAFLADLDKQIKANAPVMFEYDKERDQFYVGIFNGPSTQNCVGCYTIPGNEMDEYIRANDIDYKKYMCKAFSPVWKMQEGSDSFLVDSITESRTKEGKRTWTLENVGKQRKTWVDKRLLNWIQKDVKNGKYTIHGHQYISGMIMIYADEMCMERVAMIAPVQGGL